MRHLNIEWGSLIVDLETWTTLAYESKEAYLQLKPNQYTRRSRFDQDDVQRLIDKGLLAASSDGDKVRVPPRGRAFSGAMRGMSRHPLHAGSTHAALRNYVRDHLTVEERRGLLHGSDSYAAYSGSENYHLATRQDWLQQVLDLPDAKAANQWERDHLPEPGDRPKGVQFEDGSPYFDDQAVFDAFKRLVATALTWPTPVPLAGLTELVPDVEPRLLNQAIMPAVRYLLLFPWLDEEALEPVIAVWPEIAYLLHRPEPVVPEPVEPEQVFHAPVLIEDMTSVLVEAASKPLRVLANGDGLYAKDRQRLADSAMALPDWLTPPTEDEDFYPASTREPATAEQRVFDAVDCCVRQGLLRGEEGQSGRTELQIAPAGHDWLGKDIRERLRELLDPWRASPEPKKQDKARRLSTMHVMLDGEFVAWDDAERSPWMPANLGFGYGSEMRKIDWRAAFVDILRDADGQFIPFEMLLDYHSRVNNPLLGRRKQGSYGPTPRVSFYGYGRREPNESQLETMWSDMIDGMIASNLVPLGALELGRLGDRLAIRLHDIGRYMLGLADDFECHAQPEGKVIVQPNFEISFLGPAPHAEARLGRLAERTGSRTGTMFRITRASVLAAAAAGITSDDALSDLADVSDKPLPDNVKREVQSWFDATRRVQMRQAWVIEAGDQATSTRILATLGKQARQLTPEIVEIVAKQKDNAALTRKLKAAGIFVR